MENNNKPSRTVINVLYFTDFLLAGSLNKHLFSHSHGTIDFIVSGIGCILVALVITALLIRHLPKIAVVIAIPVTLILAVLIDIV